MKYIAEQSEPHYHTVDGREFADRNMQPFMPPMQKPLEVISLTAIKDYFDSDPDGVDDTLHRIVHVRSHNLVEVVSGVELQWLRRHSYIVAKYEPKQFSYGQAHDIERFIVALQTYFKPNESTALILKLVSKLSDASTVEYEDDGQTVTAKVGIVRDGRVPVPNPVTLQPYRTFTEILQPESDFIFRLNRGKDGEMPTAALFEADGGNWQLAAMQAIKVWLDTNLPAGTIVLA